MKSFSRPRPASMRIRWLSALAVLGLLACSGEPPPQPVAPSPPKEPETAEADTAEEPEEPEAEADAGAADAAAANPPAQPQHSGRPPVLVSDPEEITGTFGSTPATKMELGDGESMAILRIPEGSLDRGYNIHFKLAPKGKNGGGLVGKIYQTRAQVAGSQYWNPVTSIGDPFLLVLPAGNKKEANLAIGEIKIDANDREKITWRVIAPVKIDDVSGTAQFELTTLSDAYLHITTKPPTEGKP